MPALTQRTGTKNELINYDFDQKNVQGAGPWRSYSGALVIFVNINNISSVTGLILTKLFVPNFLWTKMF